MLAAGTGAGQARLSAVTTLCSLLGDAKFLQYLTDKRTHAPLGLASDDRKAVDESSLRWIQTLAVLVLRRAARQAGTPTASAALYEAERHVRHHPRP
jgi:hypothetical protein